MAWWRRKTAQRKFRPEQIGAAAEAAVESKWTEEGWESLPCRLPGNRGFDHVFARENINSGLDVRIVETKANNATLGNRQMSKGWIAACLQKMLVSGNAPLVETAELVMEAQSQTTGRSNPYGFTYDEVVERVPVPISDDAAKSKESWLEWAAWGFAGAVLMCIEWFHRTSFEPQACESWQSHTNKLRSLTADQAKELIQRKSNLSLAGLTELTPEVAKILALHSGGDLFLRGLTSLTPEAAKALAKHRGWHLYLNGVAALSDPAAEALARRCDVTHLEGLITLTPKAAAALRGNPFIRIRDCVLKETTLTAQQAKVLEANHDDMLDLRNLTTLTPEWAAALAAFKGSLYLDSLITLTREAAENLAQHKGYLSLNGLTTLVPEAAKALACHQGKYLSIRGLNTLTPEAAAFLRGKAKVLLPHKFK